MKFVKNSERILGIHFFSRDEGGASVCDTRRRTFALIELDKNSQMVLYLFKQGVCSSRISRKRR